MGRIDLNGIGSIFVVLLVCAIFGLWKLIECVVWLFQNVSIV